MREEWMTKLSDQDIADLEALKRPHYDGKFASKLSHEERCSVLAVAKRGIPRPVVAAAFGIDRRTVSNIVLDHSPHYKETRNEYKRLGHEEFMAKYLTSEAIRRVKEAQALRMEDGKGQPIPADVAARMKGGPQKAANKHEGINTIACVQLDGQLERVNIFWMDNEHGRGWCWAHPDREEGIRENDVPFHTSTDAWKDAKENYYPS